MNDTAPANSPLDFKRRFIFNGSASAFGGHIIRPKDIVLEAPGASALSVTGGRSVAQLGRTQFDDLFQIDSATTFAEGLFEDRRGFLDFTNHATEQDALATVTHVYAEVFGIALGRNPRLSIRRARAELQATSPLASNQPSIRVTDDVAVEDVSVDGRRLIVELDPTPFQRLDTLAKLLVAADDPDFVEDSGDALFMQASRAGGTAPPPAGRLFEVSCGTIYATIVKSIRWDGTEFPGSQIVGNLVVIPDFGRLYFGELLITADSRRLTMVRTELGSDVGGIVSCAGGQDNGTWSP